MATLPVVRGLTFRKGKLHYVFDAQTRSNPKDDKPVPSGVNQSAVTLRTGENLPAELRAVFEATLKKVYPSSGKYSKLPELNKENLRSRPDYDDLIGAAALAIAEAANKYTPTGRPDEVENFEKVLRYAARSGINKFIAEKSETVKQGRGVIHARKTLASVEAEFRKKGMSSNVSASEIAQALGITLDEAMDIIARAASGRTTSLDVKVGDEADDDDGTSRRDLLASEESLQDVKTDLRRRLAGAEMNAIDRQFLAWRVLNKYSIEEIGRKMGMGRTMAYDTARRLNRLLGKPEVSNQ